MQPEVYSVVWGDKTLQLGPQSANVRQAFANRVRQLSLAEAKDILSGPEYVNYRAEVIGGAAGQSMAKNVSKENVPENADSGIHWTGTPSMAVASALNTFGGEVYLLRLLAGESAAKWTDDDLASLIKAKRDDAASDYRIAIDAIWEAADPKAKTGSDGSPGPGDTAGSSANSPPGTSTTHTTPAG